MVRKLPAPIPRHDEPEARALQAARELVVDALQPRGGEGAFKDFGPLHPQAGYAGTKHLMKQWALMGALNMAQVCAWGRDGIGLADEALKELIADYGNRGEVLPRFLEAYLADKLLLAGAVRRVSGPSKGRYIMADLAIARIVLQMSREFSLRPTRSPTSRRQSACSILAAVLREFGIPRPEGALGKVWKRFGPMLSTERPPPLIAALSVA